MPSLNIQAKKAKEMIARCQQALNGSADLTQKKLQYQFEIKSFADRLEQLKKCLVRFIFVPALAGLVS